MQHAKRKVGIDLDDVVFNFCAGLCAYHNKTYGTNRRRRDNKNYIVGEMFACGEAEGHKRVYDYYHSPEHGRLRLLCGALQGLKTLAEKRVPIAITARPKAVQHITEQLIARRCPGIFTEFHFLGHHHTSAPSKKSKGDICLEHDVEFMVEDALHNAESVGKNGIRVFLFDTPWNQGALPLNTTRVFGWKDLLSRVV